MVFLVVLFPVLVMAFALVLERVEVIALTPRPAPRRARTGLATVTPLGGPAAAGGRRAPLAPGTRRAA